MVLAPTVYLLIPTRPEVWQWFDSYVVDYTRLGGGIAIEHRYLGDILEGLELDGYTQGDDFRIAS